MHCKIDSKPKSRGYSSAKCIKQSQGASKFLIRAQKFIISYQIDKRQMEKLQSIKKCALMTKKSFLKDQQASSQLNQRQKILKMQKQRIDQVKRRSEAKSRKACKMKLNQSIKKKKIVQKALRQERKYQLQEKQQRQNNLIRQKSAQSFIFQDHKDTFKMVKKNRLLKSKSQKSIANQSLRETVFNKRFEEEKRKLERQNQRYEIECRKSFLRNKPLPKQECPTTQFSSILKSKSKELNSKQLRLYATPSSQARRPAPAQPSSSQGKGITPLPISDRPRSVKISPLDQKMLIAKKIGDLKTKMKKKAGHIVVRDNPEDNLEFRHEQLKIKKGMGKTTRVGIAEITY